jgi:hypothetical protein
MVGSKGRYIGKGLQMIKAGILAAVLIVPIALTPRVAAAAKLVGCEKTFRANKATYLPHRAIATTQGRSLAAPNIACGFSVQLGTKREAISEALRQCEYWARKLKLRKGQCRIREAD